MESLLPSEIARLVLGYLEEEKCEDAARSFLESSPQLQECRAVTSSGRRFSTKVNSWTLVDILEKFCAVNAIIQERLSKVSDCEQLKHCGDLLEQLRFLVDGSRGQRFVVNINVPTTSQVSGGSPIISSSMRKRHHSGSDRERSKRAQKSHPLLLGQSSEPVTSQLGCNAVETTPLEHLPGHSDSEKVEIPVEEFVEKCQEIPTTSNCSSTVPEATAARSTTESSHAFAENVEAKSSYKTSPDNGEKSQERCSTATDTKELMQYTNSEVQTNPYDVAESETESAYEPVENLSLLTKELLNRTELQERIAENINKAILPSDSSMRDVSLNESVGGEMNTSIMTELNNAIKSVVTATESDPLFAQFLDDIIGPDAGNDESPDENNDHQPVRPNEEPIKPPDSTSREAHPEASALVEKLATSKAATADVPLKNRLRSSLSHHSTRAEEDGVAEKVVPKDEAAALEDVNAAAVLSIINAISKTEENTPVSVVTSENPSANAEKAVVELEEVKQVKEIPISNPVKPLEAEKPVVALPTSDAKIAKRSNVRKPRVPKSRIKTAQPNLMSEEDIMAMPTLIVCSKEDMSTIINAAPMITEPVSSGGYRASQFVPIAPKTAEVMPKPEPIYLRTVTVPTKVSDIPKIVGEQNIQTVKAWQELNLAEATTRPRSAEVAETIAQEVPSSVATTEVEIPEKITLYGNETSAMTMLDNSIVSTLHVDEPISVTGTGLSPFLKFNNNRPSAAEPTVPTAQTRDDAAQTATTSNDDNYDHITKRTPRTLLKSRSKNNRLSMSTPRRRSSHIRALDFNTPSKSIKSARRLSTTECPDYSPKSTGFEKKVCRASLFKSPPFGAAQTPRKVKSPLKDRALCKVPIATRSPAPKLMGGWERYTGVGMILGSTSPSSSSGSPDKMTTTVTSRSAKNWDTDLRRSLAPIEETAATSRSAKKPVKKSAQLVKRQSRQKVASSATNVEIDEASNESDTKKTQLDRLIDPAVMPTSPAAENPDEKDQSTGLTSDKSKLETTPPEPEQSSVSNASRSIETAANPPTIVDTAANTPTIVDSVASGKDATVKITKRKYATLKTITTSVTKIATEANTIVESIGEYSCTEKTKIVSLPDMLQLETPRKFEGSFGIPPTPRLLSPGSSNLTAPFGQIPDDATKVTGFVSTPEFPPTPSINLTPKQSSADGTEKKEEFQACSEYYEPTSKPKDPRTIRTNDHSRHDMSLPLPAMAAIAVESRVKNITVEVARGFQATTSSNTLEITQFEVIKENLPRDEAFRELKISGGTSDVATEDPPGRDTQADAPCTKDANNTSSSLDYSSDSDTSSSSDSSTSSSSSSSSSSATSPTLDKPNDPASKIDSDTSNDSVEKSANVGETTDSTPGEPSTNVGLIDASSAVAVDASRRENSPSKVFTIAKNDEELAACTLETPAKDECLLAEAVISETPSSSKAGIETTNLNSKISALITSANREREREENSSGAREKTLPKIVSVQRILPNATITMKPPSISEDLSGAVQCRGQSKALTDAQLIKQLEEKRLRLMAKFKEKPKTSIHRPRVKRAVVIARCKKQTDEKQGEFAAGDKNEVAGVDQTQRDIGTEEARKPQDGEPTKNQRIEEKMEPAGQKSPDEEDVAKKSFDDEKKVSLNRAPKDDQEKGGSAGKNSSLDKKKLPAKKTVDEQHGESAGKKSADEDKETHKKSQKKQTQQTNDEISELPSKDKSSKDEIQRPRSDEEAAKRAEENNDREKSDKSAKSRRSRSIEKARIKTESAAGKATRSQETVRQESSERCVGDSRASQEKPAQSVENARKEKKESKEIAVSVDANRIATKSKVDLVKRDLFSDEESNDQRTTRSRTRQTSDFRGSDSADSRPSPSRLSEKNNSPSCAAAAAEDMPGVLECLDLVPTVKGDTSDEADCAILDSSHGLRHHGEYHFIYDESVSTKKRKRKFSNSELEFPVEVELSDENYRKCPKLMTATAFEEIFNLTPPRKKRATKETTQGKNKKDATTARKVKPTFKGLQEKPLATSSPVCKAASSKLAGKTLKTPKKTEHETSEPKKKITSRNDARQQQEHEKGNLKTRKRRGSASKDNEQVDKKSKLTNPQLLLNKLDLDKFLTTVHGPA